MTTRQEVTPDVEVLVLSLLRPLGTPSSTKVPARRPSTFVRVSLTGGADEHFFDEPTLLIECWAPDTVAASDLARQVRMTLVNARFDVIEVGEKKWQVYGLRADYPVALEDPDGAPGSRYQFLIQLRVRKYV